MYPPEEVINKVTEELEVRIYRTQDVKSIMCGHYCIELIVHMNSGGNMLDCVLQFKPNNFKKNDDIIKHVFPI